jgi:DNA-binding NarL/FixJ family response regulator
MQGVVQMTTIVLADDHQLVRLGIRALLAAEPQLRVVGEAGDGLETINLVERLQPDFLVLDLIMPGLSGLDVIERARGSSPDTHIIVLSMHSNEAYVVKALQLGADAYVLKESLAADLVQAVHEAQAGRVYLSPPLSDRMIKAYVGKTQPTIVDSYDRLTPREKEVLLLAADGCSNADIAARLSLSPRTVETHRSNLMHKLDLRTHAELLRYAIGRGIVPQE